MKILISCFFLSLGVPSAFPQSSDPTTATVHIYRYKQMSGKLVSPSVYVDDDVELARMVNGRRFVARVRPGKHLFYSNDRQAGAFIEGKAGESYYVRIELATGALKGHGRVVLVPKEQGEFEVKTLKWLDPDQIRNREIVKVAELKE